MFHMRYILVVWYIDHTRYYEMTSSIKIDIADFSKKGLIFGNTFNNLQTS